MGDFARITLTGVEGLKKKLAAMDAALKEQVLRAATFAGAEVICKQAIANAPYYTGEVSEGHPPPGTLKNSIIVKRIEELCGPYKETYYVTVRRGKVGGNTDAFYAHMVEYGHFTRQAGGRMKGSARSKAAQRVAMAAAGVKFIPADPFMRTAFEMTKSEAVRAIENKLSEKLKAIK